MSEIILLRPTKQYAKQVMALREEFLAVRQKDNFVVGIIDFRHLP